MSKIYGPFHALNNPLVMANMGLFALKQGMEIKQAYDQHQQDEFLKQALVTGQPVSEMQGGPFRQGLSKLTGGLVRPNVEASGDTMVNETLALRKQQGENIKELEALGPLREEMGAGPFTSGPLADLSSRLSGTTTPFSGETLKEKELKQKTYTESIPYKTAVSGAQEQKKLDVQNEPANVQAALSRDHTKTTQDAQIRSGVEHSRFMAEQPVKEESQRRLNNEKALDADTRLDATPVAETGTNKKIATTYVNRDTLEPATGKKGEPQTYKDARTDPRYAAVPYKNVQGAYGLNAAKQHIAKLEYLKTLVPKVFPDTRLMNPASAAIARTTSGFANLFGKGGNKTKDEFYTGMAEQAAYMKELTGRFNMTELNIPALPDPGDVANVTGSWNPIRHIPIANSADVATQRINDMINAYKSVFVPTGGYTPDKGVFDPTKVEP